MRYNFASLTGALIALPLFLAGGCGGSGTSQPDGLEVHGMVLSGGRSAIANEIGADRLVPVGTGVAVNASYDDGLTVFRLKSPQTDSQGRFTFRMKKGHYEYYCDIADTCSTVAGIEDGQSGSVFVSYRPGYADGHTPSAAMVQKAYLAAKALGVDVVVIISTDVDACVGQPYQPR
jgi:hypothetical protein